MNALIALTKGGKVKKIAVILAIVLILSGMGSIRADEDSFILKPEYESYCRSAGEEFGVSPELLMAIVEKESSGDPDAVGKDGDMGLCQIITKFHMERVELLGVTNIMDPKGNIRVAASYLADLAKRYEDPGTVLMIYNGTKDAIKKGEAGEYTEYATDILDRSARLERIHGK